MSKLHLCIFALIFQVNVCEAAIKVNIQHTQVEVEISPQNQTHRSNSTFGFELNGNSIKVKSGTSKTGFFETNGRLGDVMEAVGTSGRHYKILYQFKDNVITQKLIFNGFTEIDTIRSMGSECSVQSIFTKGRGQTYYENVRVSNGEKMFISDMYAENERCQIVQLPSP